MKLMQHTIVMLLALGFSPQILGQTGNPTDWKSMGADSTRQVFYSPGSIQGELNDRKMKMKINFLGEIKDGNKSRVIEYSINCIERTYIFESLKNYTEIDLMGIEKTLLRPHGNEKKNALPNTLANQWVDIACKYKNANNNDKIVTKNSINENKILEKNNSEKSTKRTSENWYEINIGKMDAALRTDKGAFMTWYVENPEHHTGDCTKTANPSSMITFLKDTRHYGSNESPKTEITENSVIENVPVDITVYHTNSVQGSGEMTIIKLRYVRGKSECKEVFRSLVNPIKQKIESDLNKAKLLGDRYK